jgi:hypothetical protein
MLVSFFTAMSWFRSWASYFSGYNAAPQPEHTGCPESKDAGENGCMGGQLVLEQIENKASEPRSRPLAVEKHDGAGESGDVAGAWD